MTLDELRFASRFDGVSGSAIREIFKMIAKPGMISFAGGNPSPAALPDDTVRVIADEVLREKGKVLLQYGAQLFQNDLLVCVAAWRLQLDGWKLSFGQTPYGTECEHTGKSPRCFQLPAAAYRAGGNGGFRCGKRGDQCGGLSGRSGGRGYHQHR